MRWICESAKRLVKRARGYPLWALIGHILSRPYWTGVGVLAVIAIGGITIWLTVTLYSTNGDSAQRLYPVPPGVGESEFAAISQQPYLLATALVSNAEETKWRTEANVDVGDWVFLYLDVSNYGAETARNVRIRVRPFTETEFLLRPTFVASASNAQPGTAMAMIYAAGESKFTLGDIRAISVSGDLNGDGSVDVRGAFAELDEMFGDAGYLVGDLSRGDRPGYIQINFTARVTEVK